MCLESCILTGPLQSWTQVPLFNLENKPLSRTDEKIIFSDYNGVLEPKILEGNENLSEEQSKELEHSLRAICENPKNHVWIISRKPIFEIGPKWGGIKNLNIIGESGGTYWDPVTSKVRLFEHADWGLETMKKKIAEFPMALPHKEAYFLEEGLATYAISYPKETDMTKYVTELRKFLEKDFSFIDIEDRPAGLVVNMIPKSLKKELFVMKKLEEVPNANFGMVIGDSKPDEGMFALMNKHQMLSVRVNSFEMETQAKHILDSVAEVHALLKRIEESDKAIIP
ncbi:hypothetical protein O181_057081 [Austropuccinia psidii MF-1]|uniref:Trehalose-phosphatase n=1 Tax=Austropuccinia psidii MF-1 TaxID=1389203 RepID=A0A9Q3E7L5_9BASI|nr:hypothetical protein [Austropuccinia psidii MF-1]